VLSKTSYYLAGIVGTFVVVGILAWNVRSLLDARRADHDKTTQSDRRLPELLKLAAGNDAKAEYELARMYANGYGVQRNLQEEHKWLERAARHGNVQAQYEYGVALRDGHGTVQDYEGAHKWMQLAAEGSNGQAQLALGLMYRTGRGLPIDNVKAYVWFNVAAAQGVPGATAARETVLPRLSAGQLQEAQAESKRLRDLYTPKTAQPAQ